MLRTNAPPLPRATPTMQSMWQLILPMHNATNQPLGLPKAAAIRLPLGFCIQSDYKKAQQEQTLHQFCQAEQGTPVMLYE
jgi:hypothetical protein